MSGHPMTGATGGLESAIDDLKAAMQNKGDGTEWYAGSQLEALRHYLKPEVRVLASWSEDNYQGDVYAVLEHRGRVFLWRDSFGSCSGCDALDGADGYEYIAATLTAGNVQAFESLDALATWAKDAAKSYWWADAPYGALITAAREGSSS